MQAEPCVCVCVRLFPLSHGKRRGKTEVNEMVGDGEVKIGKNDHSFKLIWDENSKAIKHIRTY